MLRDTCEKIRRCFGSCVDYSSQGHDIGTKLFVIPKGIQLYVAGSLLVLGAVMIAGICKKLGVGAKQKGGEYSLAYRKDEECSISNFFNIVVFEC